ncbi:MAG: PPA1309 family protein [Pseudonocardiaceae bacterium]
MSDPSDSQPYPSALSRALPAITREVEEFVAAAGWDQQPQLFALVTTETLLASQPELADQLDPQAPLTPVAQDTLPQGDLDAALAGIEWPDSVAGCALVQEIVVLPPEAEAALGELPDDPVQARRAAAGHPQRREGRLVAAVLRDGLGACVLRLRATPEGAQGVDEVVENPQLAPNLLDALLATLH